MTLNVHILEDNKVELGQRIMFTQMAPNTWPLESNLSLNIDLKLIKQRKTIFLSRF